jgi:hypothetical protein
MPDTATLERSLQALRDQLALYDAEHVPVETFNTVESSHGRLVAAAQRVFEEYEVNERSSPGMRELLAAVMAAPEPTTRVGDDKR